MVAITYPLSFPTTRKPTMINIRANPVVALSQSPYTGASQAQEHAGQWWRAEITLPPLIRSEAAAFQAFLLKLNGMFGSFLLGDPLGKTGRGVLTGTPLVKGAGQVAGQRDLLIDGATPNTTNWIREGDYIQLGSGATSRLHMQLLDANSNGSGEVSLTLWPTLRESPSDNAPVVINDCKGVFRLASNDIGWNEDQAMFYSMSFNALEVV